MRHSMGESADLLCWDDIGERKLSGLDLILQIVKKVAKIKKHMKATQDRQKKWVDAKRRPLEFAVGDHVFIKISPTRGVIRFSCSGKLVPDTLDLLTSLSESEK